MVTKRKLVLAVLEDEVNFKIKGTAKEKEYHHVMKRGSNHLEVEKLCTRNISPSLSSRK